MSNLPYDFDLHWDVKDMEQVERIAKEEPDCSDADGYDLYNMFVALEMVVPQCLASFRPTSDYTSRVAVRVSELMDRVKELEEEVRYWEDLNSERG